MALEKEKQEINNVKYIKGNQDAQKSLGVQVTTAVSLLNLFIREIDDLVQNLEKFRAAIDKEDSAELESLMASANKIKEEIG